MNEIQEKIINRLQQASLSADDLALWENIIVYLPMELQSNFADFLDASPESIEYMNSNLRKKIQAIQNNDEALLEEILTDQKNFFQSLVPGKNISI